MSGKPACSAGMSPAVSVQYLPENGWHHHAYMSGLAIDTAYAYSVGEGPAGPWSDVFTFTNKDSRPNASFAVSVYGDMGWLDSKQRPDMCVFFLPLHARMHARTHARTNTHTRTHTLHNL